MKPPHPKCIVTTVPWDHSLFHNQSRVGHEARLLERLGHVNVALERLPGKRRREAADLGARLALHGLGQLKQRRLGRQRLHDVSAGRLQPQTGLVVVRLGLGRRGNGSSRHRDGGGGLWCSALARRLGLVGLALALGLVGLNLGLDALLGLNVVELLLTLAGGLFDLLLALQLLLCVLRLLCRLLSDLLVVFPLLAAYLMHNHAAGV